MWRVDVFEMEKGWGKSFDETKVFNTKEEADTFVREFNSENNKLVVPDWYMYAGEPYYV